MTAISNMKTASDTAQMSKKRPCPAEKYAFRGTTEAFISLPEEPGLRIYFRERNCPES